VPHRVLPDEESFQQLMHQNLARAPWLGLSIVAHAIALLLAFLLITPDRVVKSQTAVMVAPEEIPEIIPDEPKPKVPDEVPVPLEDLVEFVENPVLDNTKHDNNELAEHPDDTEIASAFDSNLSNTALGPLGGAAGRGGLGGKYGGRPSGGSNKPQIRRALRWLALHQDADGRWDADGFMKHDTKGQSCDGAGSPTHDVGVTGLALLAFLADGNTIQRGRYADHVRRGVQWLRSQQGDSGRFGTDATNDFIYDHCLATLAMCEAMGLSRYRILRSPVQSAINYLEHHRNPYGTWRYQPRSGDSDTSVTGWALMALKSAKDFDLQVNPNAFAATGHFLDEMTDPASGRCGYNQRGGLSSRHHGAHATAFPPTLGETMTAVGLFSRFFLGQDPADHAVMKAAADTILSKPPRTAEPGAIDHYYWYYATYALYQMGGQAWRQWSKSLSPAVEKTQREDGNFAGSWDPNGAWGETGGRVYSTAILVLTLQAYYRYTRVLVR
jgi:hypothetical protein